MLTGWWQGSGRRHGLELGAGGGFGNDTGALALGLLARMSIDRDGGEGGTKRPNGRRRGLEGRGADNADQSIRKDGRK